MNKIRKLLESPTVNKIAIFVFLAGMVYILWGIWSR